MTKEELFVNDLDLSPILSNLDILDREFKVNLKEIELQDTEGNYYFADVNVTAIVGYDDYDNSYSIKEKSATVEFYEKYFGHDKDGGELELHLEVDAGIVSDLIEEKILNYLV